MTARGGTNIDQQIGRLAEAVEDSKEDRTQMRSDFRDGVAALNNAVSSLGGDVRQLSQIATSTANQVAELVKQELGNRMFHVEAAVKGFETRLDRYEEEDCDKRLRALEADSRLHKIVIGAGLGLVGRVLALIAASGIVGALVTKVLHL